MTEGLIASPQEIGVMRCCESGVDGEANQLWIERAPCISSPRPTPPPRSLYSSCALCGREAIMQIAEGLAPFPLSPITPPEIFAAARRLHEEQQLFKQTGGTHAAALLETPVREDSPCFVRENSGRHNALDKAVGAAALQRVRLQQPLLLLTSRLSFELIAKAARAEIGAVAGFSAPTALLSNWRGG